MLGPSGARLDERAHENIAVPGLKGPDQIVRRILLVRLGHTRHVTAKQGTGLKSRSLRRLLATIHTPRRRTDTYLTTCHRIRM